MVIAFGTKNPIGQKVRNLLITKIGIRKLGAEIVNHGSSRSYIEENFLVIVV